MTQESTNNTKIPQGLSINLIKLISVCLMLADHYGWIQLSLFDAGGQVIHFFGRVTMPVMCYFAALGFSKTHSVGKYLARLFVFAVLAQPFFNLVFDETVWKFPPHLNVLFTLFLSICFLCVTEARLSIFKNAFARGSAALVIVLISDYCDWSFWAVAMTAAFYFFVVKPLDGRCFGEESENKALRKKRAVNILVILSVVAALLVSITYLECYGNGAHTAAVNAFYRAGVILAAPLLICYNGEKAKGGKLSKYFFYIFYPAHLAVLWILFFR